MSNSRRFRLERITEGPDKDQVGIFNGDSFIGIVDPDQVDEAKSIFERSAKYAKTGDTVDDDTVDDADLSPTDARHREKIDQIRRAQDRVPEQRRLEPKELAQIAAKFAGQLDALEPELAARAVNYLADHPETDFAEVLREVTKTASALWDEHRSKHMTAYKE